MRIRACDHIPFHLESAPAYGPPGSSPLQPRRVRDRGPNCDNVVQLHSIQAMRTHDVAHASKERTRKVRERRLARLNRRCICGEGRVDVCRIGSTKGKKWEEVMSRGSRSTRSGGRRVVADVSTSATANGSAKKLTAQKHIGILRREGRDEKGRTFGRSSDIPGYVERTTHDHDSTDALAHERTIYAQHSGRGWLAGLIRYTSPSAAGCHVRGRTRLDGQDGRSARAVGERLRKASRVGD
jgi:hypothetical protein